MPWELPYQLERSAAQYVGVFVCACVRECLVCECRHMLAINFS